MKTPLPNLLQGPSAAGTASSQFFYGPDRQRYKQVATSGSVTQTTRSIGGLVEQVVSGATTTWKHSILAPTGVVGLHTRSSSGVNETLYFTKDPLDSIDSISNAAGGVLVRLSYDAFGKRRQEAGWSGSVPASDYQTINATSRRGYTGHEMLDNLGLIHMNGRVYHSTTSRFLSPDPFVPEPFNLQSLNRYSYVRNSPLSLVDPTGFTEEGVIEEVTTSTSRIRYSIIGPMGISMFSMMGPIRSPQAISGGGDQSAEDVIEEVVVEATTQGKQNCTRAASVLS